MKKEELIKMLAKSIIVKNEKIKLAEQDLMALKLAKTTTYELAKRKGVYLEVIQEVQRLEREERK